ncbi:MAG: SAM-dependent methyltransferase [Rhizomicrobium sp.]|nr:SAM-dependent methyltransferase [Rhizomicrobium sp.]
MANGFLMKAVGIVRAGRQEPLDDGWDEVPARIELDTEQFGAEALLGLEQFSHVEVLFYFHAVSTPPETAARRPRGRQDWPKVGIFAQRAKDRPNHLGATICRLLSLEGSVLTVAGLDAIDGTPVLDIKPVWSGFLPRGAFREPDWAKELMRAYW